MGPLRPPPPPTRQAATTAQQTDVVFRARALLARWMGAHAQIPGFIEACPGVRSLMVEYDMRVLSPAQLLEVLGRLDAELPDPHTVTLPSRTVRLPMAFDDSATHEAIEKYMKRWGVRSAEEHHLSHLSTF